jgi:hypothetical protein
MASGDRSRTNEHFLAADRGGTGMEREFPLAAVLPEHDELGVHSDFLATLIFRSPAMIEWDPPSCHLDVGI